VATPAPRTIVSAVRAFARRHGIFRPGPLVVAVSGGTDSVALALILAELRDEFGLVLHVAHFDHRTRPRSSAKDAAFVAEIADRIGAPIRVGRAARAPKNEDDARQARYTFLRRAAMQLGAGAIATGHTMDDQAETVLLHLARGSGLQGATGMRPLRDGIARPLLAIGRAETAAICKAAKIRPREDPSNASLRFARNRVRLRVLPELERINPKVRAALARFADAAAENEPDHTMSGVTSADAGGLVSRTDEQSEHMTLDVADLPTDAAARDRMLAEAWRSATGVTLSARQRAALSGLVKDAHGSRKIDLPGGQAVREYARLELGGPTAAATSPARPKSTAPKERAATAPMPLARGSTAEWHGWRIALDMPVDGSPYSASLPEEDAASVVVRARRPGDRMRGRGKLQDVFVNSKVPARLRDTWPLVTLNGEVIVWVPGVTPAPRSGPVSISAWPNDIPGEGASSLRNSSQNRQVASNSERRPRAGRENRSESG
jgi:tRNA(Ile)-lysidine synthase